MLHTLTQSVTANAGAGWADSGIAKESGGFLQSLSAACAAMQSTDGVKKITDAVTTIPGTGWVDGKLPGTPLSISDYGVGVVTSSGAWLEQPTTKTDTQPVSGTFYPAVQSISGQVWANFPASQAVTSITGQVFANQNGSPWDVRKVGLVKEAHDAIVFDPPGENPTRILYSNLGALIATVTLSWSGTSFYKAVRS